MISLRRVEITLLFLIILFLPTQLGRHFWPDFAFVYSLPIDYLSPTIYFWDLLVILLAVFFLLQKKHINKLALNLYYFFILTQVLSLLAIGANIGAGLVRLEQYLIAGLFGVYIASQNFKEIKGIIFLGLTLAVIGESLLAIGQFMTSRTMGFWLLGERAFTLSTPGIAKFDFYSREFLRPYGTFSHPNVLAGFMLITLLILPARKAVAVLGGLILFLTISRVTIVAGFISAMLTLKSQGRKLVILIAVLLLPILYTRYASLLNFDHLALIRREDLSITAFTLWQQSPVLGKGLNNFIPSGADSLLTGTSRFLQPVHNIFLLTLSETGLIGLIGLVSLIGYPIFKKKLLLVWGVIIFLGLFDHYFLTLPQGYRLLFLVWGLSIAMLE